MWTLTTSRQLSKFLLMDRINSYREAKKITFQWTFSIWGRWFGRGFGIWYFYQLGMVPVHFKKNRRFSKKLCEPPRSPHNCPSFILIWHFFSRRELAFIWDENWHILASGIWHYNFLFGECTGNQHTHLFLNFQVSWEPDFSFWQKLQLSGISSRAYGELLNKRSNLVKKDNGILC